MEISAYFPIWDRLTKQQQEKLSDSAVRRDIEKGTVLHNGSTDCLGLLLVCSGQLRACIYSEEGREITIYRLFERDICLFSASCMMRSIQFEVTIEAEKATQLWIIPAQVYQEVMKESAPLANYTNEIMASRFSDVMWLIEQVLWKSFDKRLAAFLLEEARIYAPISFGRSGALTELLSPTGVIWTLWWTARTPSPLATMWSCPAALP